MKDLLRPYKGAFKALLGAIKALRRATPASLKALLRLYSEPYKGAFKALLFAIKALRRATPASLRARAANVFKQALTGGDQHPQAAIAPRPSFFFMQRASCLLF